VVNTGRPLGNIEMGNSHSLNPLTYLPVTLVKATVLWAGPRHASHGIGAGRCCARELPFSRAARKCRDGTTGRREWACNEPGIPERLGSGLRDATSALARMSSRYLWGVERAAIVPPANFRTPLVFVIISSPAKSEAAGLPREAKLPSRDRGPAAAPDTPSVRL